MSEPATTIRTMYDQNLELARHICRAQHSVDAGDYQRACRLEDELDGTIVSHDTSTAWRGRTRITEPSSAAPPRPSATFALSERTLPIQATIITFGQRIALLTCLGWRSVCPVSMCTFLADDLDYVAESNFTCCWRITRKSTGRW